MQVFITPLPFSVYHWKLFPFEDKSQKDKFLICLNYNNENIYAVLPTSRADKFYTEAALTDVVSIEANESKYFKKLTIIDLKNIKEVSELKLKKAWGDGQIEYLGLLEDYLIKKAIKDAVTISPEKQKLLLEDV